MTLRLRPSSLGVTSKTITRCRAPDLIGRQTDARGLIHGIGHIIDKALDILVNLFNRPGFCLEDRLRIFLYV